MEQGDWWGYVLLIPLLVNGCQSSIQHPKPDWYTDYFPQQVQCDLAYCASYPVGHPRGPR